MSDLVKIISHTVDSKNAALCFVVDCDGTRGEVRLSGDMLYVPWPLHGWAEEIVAVIRELKGAMFTEKD